MAKWIYGFGDGKAEGSAEMKDLLGGKGAGLAEMSNLGLPVPPGFTITTGVCTFFYDNHKTYPPNLTEQLTAALAQLEASFGCHFGDTENPLLVSVRSGARASMPGMMDTVLNLGLNDRTVEGLAKRSGDPRFAWDSYRRFIQMYGQVVLGVEHHRFEELIDNLKLETGAILDTDLGAEDWRKMVAAYKRLIEDTLGHPFPEDPQEQLWGAIGAVFGSWMNQRAITYRRLHDIPADWGTAVNVQAMVFGNMGEDCATGVAFTRNPSTGDDEFFGEYLINAQGEDVVAGIRTPQHLTVNAKLASGSTLPAMEEVMPEVFAELNAIRGRLERHYRDMQDVEFTVQRKKLWMLQTRNGKRTAPAALKIAVDMVRDDLITKEEAIQRIEPNSLDQLLHPTLDPRADTPILARGLPASPGAASGIVVFSAEEAEKLASKTRAVILVRIETSPEDIHGMHAATGILTTRGGMTSHAAVVARGMGRPCVAGAGDLRIDYKAQTLTARGIVVKAGDKITINGSTGEIMLGEVPTIQPELSGDFAVLMSWADEVRRMRIRANAETPEDALMARRFGAEGIGLCRTEHMFFAPERILTVREMIMADDTAGRRVALQKLQPMQRSDFKALFSIMKGLPVTIRLLDPPLHEFLPKTDEEFADLALATGKDVSALRFRAGVMYETNPMLGHRGCRLGITYPEIYDTQVRAIFEAVVEILKETGDRIHPEIMLPLISSRKEFDILKQVVDTAAAEITAAAGVDIPYEIGTMIELPRAALLAGDIAQSAEFFSFGTNDLTQTTYGLSRDDVASFFGTYQKQNIFEHDPFVSLDIEGVGELVRIAAERGRKTRPGMKLGICGEHGGDPSSIQFCEKVRLDYVSCSPYRVPIARLAAAQATLSSTTDAGTA